MVRLGGLLGVILGYVWPSWRPDGNMKRHLGRLGPSWTVLGDILEPSEAEKPMGDAAALGRIGQVRTPAAEAERSMGYFLKGRIRKN